MRTAILKTSLFVVILLGVTLVVLHQRRTTGELQDEISRQQEEKSRHGNSHAAHQAARQQRLQEETDRLRAAEAEASRLRREIADLEHALSAAMAKASPPAPPASENPPVAPKAWTNSGSATPAAAFETVLWSALNGDTDTLASLIAFDPVGRARVEALFARLPEAQRAASGSPEKVFATLMAVRLPQDLSAAEVVTSSQTAEGATLRLRLEHTGGAQKEANFRFDHTPSGWRLVVPTSVVDNYQQMLANAPK